MVVPERIKRRSSSSYETTMSSDEIQIKTTTAMSAAMLSKRRFAGYACLVEVGFRTLLVGLLSRTVQALLKQLW